MGTPREEQLRALFGTLNTEQQETLTSARGAVDRMAAKAAAAEALAVSEEVSTEFSNTVSGLKADADAAQAAFDAIGVPATPPADGGGDPSISSRGRR